MCEWVQEELVERILWSHPGYLLCNNAIVIGYPYGDTSMRAKLADISYAADMFPFANFDYVPCFSNVFEGRMDVVKSEIQAARAMVERQLRLIVEVGMFKNRKEYSKLYDLISLAEDCGVEVIKSSTGTYKNDCSIDEKLDLISKTSLKKKISGGINTVEAAEHLIEGGADILGSSSAIDLIFKYMQS
jgi:deoxyribose-phosphate aldolase